MTIAQGSRAVLVDTQFKMTQYNDEQPAATATGEVRFGNKLFNLTA
jgi:hypothetical protein